MKEKLQILLYKLRLRRGERRTGYEIDMVNGPLFGKIVRFAVPLMISGMLQLLFNAADIIVVGNFAGATALAAVGSTGALINLLVNLFIGLSVGTNVLVARYYGAGDVKHLSEVVHTSVLTSLVSGGVLVVVGLIAAEPLLTLMGTPDDVLSQAALYMRIYFCGMPVTMLYNFGSAILRSVGDTKRPLYFLMMAGVLNVGLNLFFVIVFHMGVAGVALATVISQALSAGLVLLCLVRTHAAYRVDLKHLHIYKDKLIGMMKIGLPAGMQGMVFSISNVLIQSSINSFGSIAMAGSTAASNIENFVYMAMNTFYQTSLSFTGQNVGAKRFDRVKRIAGICVGCVTVVGITLGCGAYLFGHQLLPIYNSDPDVIAYGMIRLLINCTPYFLCGVMDTLVGSIRGLGYSVMPMIVSLLGSCATRVVWILTVFAAFHSFEVLFLIYPISWGVTAVAHFICFLLAFRRRQAQLNTEHAAE